MRVVVTGATGLLGGNLALLLADAGHEVVATRRATSRTDHLDRPIRWVEADLSDVDALTRAFEGADAVFHCAAAVSIRYEIEPWLEQANVVGTENVITAVQRAGAGRLVYCSTIAVLGVSPTGEPSDETAPYNFEEYGLADAYVRTKRQAQERVDQAIAEGLDAVVVHPSFMLGPYDARPSSGQLIVNVVRGRVPGYTLGRNNFSDVRDVARGAIAAWERGGRGEHYILGGHNLTYQQIFERIAQVAGVRPPRIRFPDALTRGAGLLGELAQRISGRDMPLNKSTSRWSLEPNFVFTSAKAERELGYRISPLEPAIADAIDWLRAHGKL